MGGAKNRFTDAKQLCAKVLTRMDFMNVCMQELERCWWKLRVMQYKAIREYNTLTCPLGCVFSPGCWKRRDCWKLHQRLDQRQQLPRGAGPRVPAVTSLSPFRQAADDPAGGHAPQRAGGRGEPLHPLRGAAGAAGICLRCLRGLQEGETSPRCSPPCPQTLPSARMSTLTFGCVSMFVPR